MGDKLSTLTSETPSLKDKGIFLLTGEVNESSAKEIVTWILESNFAVNPGYSHLTLIVHSPGGSVPASFAIIDAMRGSALPVHTVGLGQVGSCALSIFMAGYKGGRVLTPNTSILSHQWSWGNFGKQHELVAAVREYDLTTQRIVDHYRKCTGLSDEVIRQKLLPAEDVWLSAEEAKVLNICDHIKAMN
jgi:ATP-dependent Clp protease protease subunit